MTESLRKVYEDAKQGNAEAQLRIGDCYFWGYGTEKNSAEARDWYKKAAEQGSAAAQCALGDYYRRFEREEEEAEACYRKAAEQDYAAAQHKLGLYYCDADEAIEWYRKAAEQGYAKAQCTLGDCCYNGEGIEKDLKEAVKWYQKAAELGLAEAQWRLGNCYGEGKGIGKNQKEAEKWRTKAAEQGYRDLYSEKECADRVKEAEEEYRIATRYEEGESEWFEHIVKAALLRYPKAAFVFGSHYYEDGKFETGLRWIDTAISALWDENYKNWRPKESPDGKLDEDEVLMFLLRESGFTTQLDSIDNRDGNWVPDYKKALEYLGYFYDTYSYLSRKFHSGIKQPPIKADDMFVEPPMFDGEYAEHNWAGSMAHTLYLNNHNYGGFSDWSPLCLDEFDVLVDSGILPNEVFLQGGIYDSMECDEDMAEDDYERYQVYSTRGGAHGGGYSDAIDSLGGYVCCVSHGEKSEEEEDSAEENCDPQTVQIVDKGDYIEITPPIGNIRMIAKEKSPEMTWDETFDYAKKLRTGGFSDWRVPTKEELEMIYRIKDSCGIMDSDWFWSSSTPSDDTDNAWLVHFSYGFVGSNDKTCNYNVRCVR